MPPAPIYVFGAFELDSGAKRLRRDGVVLDIAPRHVAILTLLLSRPGEIVTKDEAMTAGWGDVIVGDNSVNKAMSDLRLLLGSAPDGKPHIETIRYRGFRFHGAVSTSAPAQSVTITDALAGRQRWIEGRAILERLHLDQVAEARQFFEQAVLAMPRNARARVGLANACLLQHEATRTDLTADRSPLIVSLSNAREACDLDPHYGHAWSTLAMVLARVATPAEARAAAEWATTIEPDVWLHHIQLASVGRGRVREDAARRTLTFVRGFPFAHLLIATVLIARQTMDLVEREIVAGLAGLDTQRIGDAPFSGIGLHWLHGLTLNARRDVAGALAALDRELSVEGDRHIYSREVASEAWHAVGAIRLDAGEFVGAAQGFSAALARVPTHPRALAGLSIACRRMGTAMPEPAATMLALLDGRAAAPSAAEGRLTPSPGAIMDIAMARAALLREEGDVAGAAALLTAALSDPHIGSAGWLLPIEPLLSVWREPKTWAVPLARLGAMWL